MTYAECRAAFYAEIEKLEPHWKTLYALANALEHDAPTTEEEARWSRWISALERPGTNVKVKTHSAEVLSLDGVVDIAAAEKEEER